MNRLNDGWFRLIGIPLIALVSNIIFYYDMNEKHGFSFWKDYLYTLAIAFVLWEVNRQVILRESGLLPSRNRGNGSCGRPLAL
jgi:hypothetical protein